MPARNRSGGPGIESLLQCGPIDGALPSRDHDGGKTVAEDINGDKRRRQKPMHAEDDADGRYR